SLAVAAQPDLPIAAVGEFFGGLHADLVNDFKRLPPTLIVHGAKDKVVPVERAYELEKALKAKKLHYEMQIYKDQGHLFGGETMSSKVIEDAKKRTLKFLAKHLKKADR